MRKIKRFDHQLTNYYHKSKLRNVIKTLEAGGGKEGEYYEIRPMGKKYAIFINERADNE